MVTPPHTTGFGSRGSPQAGAKMVHAQTAPSLHLATIQSDKKSEVANPEQQCYLSPPIHGDRAGNGFSQEAPRKNPLGYRNRSRVRKHFHFSESPGSNLRQARIAMRDSSQAVEQQQRDLRTPPRSPLKPLYQVESTSTMAQQAQDPERVWAATYQYFDYWVFYRIEAHKQKLRALSTRRPRLYY